MDVTARTLHQILARSRKTDFCPNKDGNKVLILKYRGYKFDIQSRGLNKYQNNVEELGKRMKTRKKIKYANARRFINVVLVLRCCVINGFRPPQCNKYNLLQHFVNVHTISKVRRHVQLKTSYSILRQFFFLLYVSHRITALYTAIIQLLLRR